MTFVPIHSNEYGQNTSAVQEVAKRLFRLVILIPTWMVAPPYATLSSFAVVAANRFHSSPYRTTVGSFSGDSSKDPVVGLLNPRMLSKLSSEKWPEYQLKMRDLIVLFL